MHQLRTFTRLALLFTLLANCVAGQVPATTRRQRVSLVLTHGKIFTADARGTVAQAVAIDGERIVAVGTNAEIAARFIQEARTAAAVC